MILGFIKQVLDWVIIFAEKMVHLLKDIPAWFILMFVFFALLLGYYIRPDNVTEDSLKGVLGALLLTLRPNERQQASPPPAAPPEQQPPAPTQP